VLKLGCFISRATLVLVAVAAHSVDAGYLNRDTEPAAIAASTLSTMS